MNDGIKKPLAAARVNSLSDAFGACSVAEAALADINSRDSLFARVAGTRGQFERLQCFGKQSVHPYSAGAVAGK